jgi:PAS domain S-box-containing protein
VTFGTPSHRDRDGRFRLVADSLPLLVWISNADKRCTYFNKPWLEFTGRPLESELGDGWAGGVHAADLQHCLDAYARAFDHREPSIMEYRLRRHGEYRWVFDNAAPLFDPDGSFAGYIGTCFDMTDFRHAEAGRNLANDRLRLAMESGKSVGWVSMCSFVEPRTPSTSPFVMKALASTSMSRVEACDSA